MGWPTSMLDREGFCPDFVLHYWLKIVIVWSKVVFSCLKREFSKYCFPSIFLFGFNFQNFFRIWWFPNFSYSQFFLKISLLTVILILRLSIYPLSCSGPAIDYKKKVGFCLPKVLYKGSTFLAEAATQ